MTTARLHDGDTMMVMLTYQYELSIRQWRYGTKVTMNYPYYNDDIIDTMMTANIKR